MDKYKVTVPGGAVIEVEAHTVTVTDGGVLYFRNIYNRIIRAFPVGEWVGLEGVSEWNKPERTGE